MSEQVSSELLQLWTLAVQGDNPSGRIAASELLGCLRGMYGHNRGDFSQNDLKIIDVAKVLLGMQERIGPQFLPQQVPDSSGNLYLSVKLPDSRPEIVIIHDHGSISLATMIPKRRTTHCYGCRTFLDERDRIPKCTQCGWMVCPECRACGCQYVEYAEGTQKTSGDVAESPF